MAIKVVDKSYYVSVFGATVVLGEEDQRELLGELAKRLDVALVDRKQRRELIEKVTELRELINTDQPVALTGAALADAVAVLFDHQEV